MLCYAMPCYAMPSYAMLCPVHGSHLALLGKSFFHPRRLVCSPRSGGANTHSQDQTTLFRRRETAGKCSLPMEEGKNLGIVTFWRDMFVARSRPDGRPPPPPRRSKGVLRYLQALRG